MELVEIDRRDELGCFAGMFTEYEFQRDRVDLTGQQVMTWARAGSESSGQERKISWFE